ncbi:MAG: methyltransferase domain-containing protein [Isosphaeraceae bacterium]
MATPPPAGASLDDELIRLYAQRFPERERLAKAKLWRTLCASFFSRYVPKDGIVVDIGAGYCDFLNAIEARRRIAVDLNPDTARYADPGIEVIAAPVEQLDAVLPADSVDFAFASNVFEHLRSPDHLLRALVAVRAILRPGGRLMIMQPNARILGGKFWDFFDHTLPLSEKGMAEALSLAGLPVIEARARFLPYTTKGRLPKWPWLVKLYLAMPPAHWLFGGQMLVVARKPARP